jgi:hypothetical protein
MSIKKSSAYPDVIGHLRRALENAYVVLAETMSGYREATDAHKEQVAKAWVKGLVDAVTTYLDSPMPQAFPYVQRSGITGTRHGNGQDDLLTPNPAIEDLPTDGDIEHMMRT